MIESESESPFDRCDQDDANFNYVNTIRIINQTFPDCDTNTLELKAVTSSLLSPIKSAFTSSSNDNTNNNTNNNINHVNTTDNTSFTIPVLLAALSETGIPFNILQCTPEENENYIGN